MKKTKKNFALTLDNWYPAVYWRNFRYGNRKRSYGSYLYSQDKVMFNLLFEKWEPTDTQEQFESK